VAEIQGFFDSVFYKYAAPKALNLALLMRLRQIKPQNF
jgi:hypothetical protein